MSRLDSVIRRLEAQRLCLALAAQLVREVPGPVLELGLGNGRTYDHLCELLPDREIFAFDRVLAAHPACVPDERHLVLGDFADTLPHSLARLRGRAALAHADMGDGDAARSAARAAQLAPLIDSLMAPGGVVLGDQSMTQPRWRALPLPAGVAAGRYFIYRVAGG